MNSNKKYILSILFLFSTASVQSEIPYQPFEIRTSLIGLFCIAVTPWLLKKSIKFTIQLIDRQLCQIIFGKKYTHYSSTYNLDEATIDKTKWHIEKYGPIIRILLKFLLFVEHTSTQHSYAEYIHNAYSSEKYTETKAIIQFLFDCGINPRFLRTTDKNLLTRACLNTDPDSIALVESLLKTLKVDPNNRDLQIKDRTHGHPGSWPPPQIEDSSDALSVACYANNNKAVKLLIQCNTHTHPFLDLDPMSRPPILRAIQHKNTEMFRDLFLFTVYKTTPAPIIYKMWQLTHIIKDKDLRKITANNLVNLLIVNSSDALLDKCFTCDEKIWLPHQPNDFCMNCSKVPSRMKDKDISFYPNKRISHNQYKTELKSKVKEFLPRFQITC